MPSDTGKNSNANQEKSKDLTKSQVQNEREKKFHRQLIESRGSVEIKTASNEENKIQNNDNNKKKETEINEITDHIDQQDKRWKDYDPNITETMEAPPAKPRSKIKRVGRSIEDTIFKSKDKAIYAERIGWGEKFKDRPTKEERSQRMDQYFEDVQKTINSNTPKIHDEVWKQYINLVNVADNSQMMVGDDSQYQYEGLYKKTVEKIMGMVKQLGIHIYNEIYDNRDAHFQQVAQWPEQWYPQDQKSKRSQAKIGRGKMDAEQFQQKFNNLYTETSTAMGTIGRIDKTQVLNEDQKNALAKCMELEEVKGAYDLERLILDQYYNQNLQNLYKDIADSEFDGRTMDELKNTYKEQRNKTLELIKNTDPFSKDDRMALTRHYNELIDHYNEVLNNFERLDSVQDDQWDITVGDIMETIYASTGYRLNKDDKLRKSVKNEVATIRDRANKNKNKNKIEQRLEIISKLHKLADKLEEKYPQDSIEE